MVRPLAELEIIRGGGALPFIQELGAFVWGHDQVDSDGDCRWPLDRTWSELSQQDRSSGAFFEVAPGRSDEATQQTLLRVEGSSEQVVLCAAYLIALRCGGRVRPRDAATSETPRSVGLRVEGLAQRLARADAVQETLLDPNLRPWW